MFLSCCLSLLLSWRISSRSLASLSSPPATWNGYRGKDRKGGDVGFKTKWHFKHSSYLHRNIFRNIVWISDISSQKIFKASVGTQKIYFTAYWLCQQHQADKSQHHLWCSCYICKTGNSFESLNLHQSCRETLTQTWQSQPWTHIHLCHHDFWSLPCDLWLSEPTLSASPPSSLSPSEPSSSPPELSSPQLLLPVETINII